MESSDTEGPSLERAVAHALVDATSQREAIPRALEAACEAGGWDLAIYWLLDRDDPHLRWYAGHRAARLEPTRFEALCHDLTFAPGMDLPGRVWEMEAPVWVPDIVSDVKVVRSLAAAQTGLHAALALPVHVDGVMHGVVELLSHRIGEPDKRSIPPHVAAADRIGRHLDRARQEEALRYRALHDELTGLPNEAHFRERLERAVRAATEATRPLALLLIELDGLQRVNETYGQQTGELLLQEIARRLSAALRRSDTVGRLGEGRFAILLPSTNTDQAEDVGRKLLERITTPLIGDGMTVRIEASVGIAIYPGHGADPSVLLHRADTASRVARGVSSRIAVSGGHSSRP